MEGGEGRDEAEHVTVNGDLNLKFSENILIFSEICR